MPMTGTEGLTPSQERAYNTILSGYNVFLTGHAGTGKSFLLRRVTAALQARGRRVVTAAPTGIAAINVGGTTLHRLFMLKPDIYTDRKERVPPVLKETDVLIIDEISMCRIDLFDYIGRVLRKVRRSIQVVAVGDFCQLPPVMTRGGRDGRIDEKEILDLHFGFDVGGGYAFLSPQWQRLNFRTVVLEEVVRQDDPAFVQALDRVRLGDGRALDYFQKNARPEPIPEGIFLAGRNAAVDRLNGDRLARLESPVRVYEAETKGEVGPEDRRVAQERLELKAGARVMLTVNGEEGTYYNGSLGYVTGLEPERVLVRLDDSGEECEVRRNSWEIIRYEVERDPLTDTAVFRRRVAGQYIQYPIRLAWAVTIHKSQGQTFSKVNLDPNCWDSGQLYVALSRVRSVDGLHLTRPLWSRYLRLDPAVAAFYENAGRDEPEDAGLARDVTLSRPGGELRQEEEPPEQFSLF